MPANTPPENVDYSTCAFSKYIRLKLIYYMLKAPVRQGGCDLSITKLLHNKTIECFFPLRENNITK
jgi:hypothetical protein